jgi:K+-sensing histidine kinase KdpD
MSMPSPQPRSPARAWLGVAAGAAALVLLTVLLAPRERSGTGPLSLTSVALLYLVPVVLVAALTGVRAGLVAALAADAVLNWFFIPPYHTLVVERGDNIVTLLVYALVATTVAVTMDLAARQRAAAARSGVEAQLLAGLAAEPVAERSLTELLEHVRTVFDMRAVALLENDPDGERVVASVGDPELTGTPALSVRAADGLRLVCEGNPVFAEDRPLLGRLAAAAARTLEAQRKAAQVDRLAEVDRARTAILAAVGHDLRTPLASIKAAASSLRAADVAFSPQDADELLATVEESADRLDDLVENLLAMSRLQAGALSVHPRAVALDEVVARALLHSGPGAPVRVEVDDALPLVLADPGLLERVVANLLANAVAASGRSGTAVPVAVRARPDDSLVRLAVVDHGDGVPPEDRERMFAPFQRPHDRTSLGGLGLGLAIARGFTEAMDGTLTATDTTGGGLTMTVTLPRAEPA